jgi:hypothetical protein
MIAIDPPRPIEALLPSQRFAWLQAETAMVLKVAAMQLHFIAELSCLIGADSPLVAYMLDLHVFTIRIQHERLLSLTSWT